MTKSISIAAIGLSMLVVAFPAFAHSNHNTNSLAIQNSADITSYVGAVSNTGLNSQTVKPSNNNSHHHSSSLTANMTTNDAGSGASANVQGVNTTTGAPTTGVNYVNNDASISTGVLALSNTGLNKQTVTGGSANMTTGYADSSASSNVQNVNVTGF